MRWLVLVAGLALMLALSAGAAQAAACDRGAIVRTAAAVHQTRGVLLALPMGDGHDTEVSVPGQAAIAAMKSRLGDFVVAFLRCEPGKNAKAIAAGLTRLAGAKSADSDYRYGSDIRFAARSAPAGLLTVTATFAIECSGDTMLMVFTPDGAGWREVLRLQSKPYKEVSGAYEFFEYGISPPDRAGNWFLVEKNIAPWCSSTWSGIDYSVLRPSGDPLKPRLLFKGSDPVWWGAEDESLRVGPGDFTVRFHAQSVDMGVHNRVWLRHFSVAGDQVTRIPPLAENPRDFAEEWIQADWKTMARWTVHPGLEALQAKLHKIAYFNYVSVRRCGASGRRQIEVEAAEGQARYYFLVGADKDFRMLDVTRAPDRTCTGPNLFQM